MHAHLAFRPAALAAALAALSPGLAAPAGTVTGKVDVTPLKYGDETVVYLEAAVADPQGVGHRLEGRNPRRGDPLHVRDRGFGSGGHEEPIEGQAGPVVQLQGVGGDPHGPAAQEQPGAHPLRVARRSEREVEPLSAHQVWQQHP